MIISSYWLRFIAFGLIGTVILLGVILGITMFTQRTASTSQPISYSMLYPHTKGDRTWYYNGNHFVSMNTATQDTISLTPKISYPINNIDSVLWTEHGVYFRFMYPPQIGELSEQYNTLVFDSLYSLRQQYWYAGFDSSDIELAFTVDESSYNSATVYGDKVIYSHDGSLWSLDRAGRSENILSVTNDRALFISPLHISETDVVVSLHGTSSTEVRRINRESKEFTTIQTIDRSRDQTSYSIANQSAVATVVTDTDSNQSLIVTELSDANSTTQPWPLYTGTIYRDGQDLYAIYAGQEEMVIYNINATSPKLVYRFADTLSFPSGALCSQDRCIYVDLNGVARIVSHNTGLLQSVKPAYDKPLEDTVAISGISITRDIYNQYTNAYEVVIGQGSVTKPYLKLQEVIKRNNIDPYAFVFTIHQGRYEQP